MSGTVNQRSIQAAYDFIDLMMSFVRMIFQSRFKKTLPFEKRHSSCLVMGNGPSLSKTLQENAERLPQYDLMAVNFMAFSPEYTDCKPDIYLLCDPAFWFENITQELQAKVTSFYERLSKDTTWDMTLYLPYQAQKVATIAALLANNGKITVHYYNKVRFDGNRRLQNAVYAKQWGMPRAQNVVSAALMIALHAGYDTIYLAGAENNNIRNLWVDNENRLRVSDSHFYAEHQNARDRVLDLPLHEQLLAMYYTFRSYHAVADFAKSRNRTIINVSPESYIDAFEKRPGLM